MSGLDADGEAHEAARQAALVAAIAEGGVALGEGCRLEASIAGDGLDAYRANAAATADRALAAIFPSVRRAVGEPTFAALARDHARDEPPTRGDLGAWGDAFPAWLGGRPAFAPWPWLPDLARLELAVHRCERAPDAVVDAASWARLGAEAPERLALRFVPGTALIASAFPIVTLHAAHREAAEPDVARLRSMLEAHVGETALVVREGWRAAVHRLDASHATFVAALLDGEDLGTALTRAGDRFDFADWLASALRAGWLAGVAAR